MARKIQFRVASRFASKYRDVMKTLLIPESSYPPAVEKVNAVYRKAAARARCGADLRKWEKALGLLHEHKGQLFAIWHTKAAMSLYAETLKSACNEVGEFAPIEHLCLGEELPVDWPEKLNRHYIARLP